MPFYQFNPFTGRLSESTHLQPLHPVSSVYTLNKADPPKMIWDSIKTKSLKTASPSSASFSTLDPKLLEKYKKFQVNIEKPVYLIGGAPDKILFTISCVLVVLGVGQCFKILYGMANPKKA